MQGLDDVFWLVRRDKRCRDDCPGSRPIYYAPRDLRVVLPGRIYGLDVTLCVGERHLCDGVALAQITRDLNAKGLPIDQRHTGRVFRDFLALTKLARGDDEALCARLRAQGGIVLMCDGVQFEDRSPVLYLVWDAISGQPLFGERKLYRGEDDLVPLLERVKAMDVPVIGIVTDKEKGLVPAMERVFRGVPYQFCHTHYLKNCAIPLKDDTSALQTSVRRRADAVRKIGKQLSASDSGPESESKSESESSTVELATGRAEPSASPLSPVPSGEPPSQETVSHPTDNAAALSEEDLAREVCELVRVNSRVSGKSPLDPPELKRDDRLENIRNFVNEAKKRPRSRMAPPPGRCSQN